LWSRGEKKAISRTVKVLGLPSVAGGVLGVTPRSPFDALFFFSLETLFDLPWETPQSTDDEKRTTYNHVEIRNR
jgi:hypothetical protein